MGRNIFQSDSPVGMIKAVRAIVHEGASVDDAYAVYMDEKAASGAARGGGDGWLLGRTQGLADGADSGG